jgi:hypothetical protein
MSGHRVIAAGGLNASWCRGPGAVARRFTHGRRFDVPICWFGWFAKADFNLRY